MGNGYNNTPPTYLADSLQLSTCHSGSTALVFEFDNIFSTNVPHDVRYIDRREGFPIKVVAHLEDMEEIDVIVNPTDKSLNLLRGGQISKTISRIGGQGIQNELNRSYPKGIEPGEVADTKGYNLPYKYVYHCSLQNINKRISHHLIREVVTKCLTEAKNQNLSSIAFPAIGTGAMNFPQRVLRTIYTTILEFLINEPGSIRNAYVLVYPGRQDLIEYLKKIDPKKEKERLSFEVQIPASWSQSDEIRRIRLYENDEEYQFVKRKFAASIKCDVKIIKIERIENKRLFVAYSRFKAQLPNSLPENQREELYVWHGTKEETIEGITRYGFDWRLTERALYGQGCYFALDASYSNQYSYARPNATYKKHMFLATIVSGKYKVGNRGVDHETEPPIYVTYDDDQMYPAYLIVYTSDSDNYRCTIS